ncbi:MAG: LLM class flavin-dependent oxidoreductase, partial [Anaerolineales bacterium]
DFSAFGEDPHPKVRAEKLDEALEVLAGLWSGETFSFQGHHYQVNGVRMLPKLYAPHIPVWVAGGWPRRKPLQRAVRWDGVYLMTYNQVTEKWLTPGEVKEVSAYTASIRQQVGPFDIAVNVEASTDPHQAFKVVKPFFDSGATWVIELDQGSHAEYLKRIRNGPPRD